MTEPHSVFVPAPDVVVRDLDGEAVVLDLATGTYFGLNDAGTRIWLPSSGRTRVDYRDGWPFSPDLSSRQRRVHDPGARR